jgi:hypothetical protein
MLQHFVVYSNFNYNSYAVIRIGCRERYLDLRGKEKQEATGDVLMRSFMIYIPHQMLIRVFE